MNDKDIDQINIHICVIKIISSFLFQSLVIDLETKQLCKHKDFSYANLEVCECMHLIFK